MDLTGDGAKAAARVVTDLAEALSRPFTIDGTAHRVRLSIGVALYPRDGSTAPELIAAADTAMYLDKSGRDHHGPGPHTGTQHDADADHVVRDTGQDMDRPDSGR